jgi:hypothetical protein
VAAVSQRGISARDVRPPSDFSLANLHTLRIAFLLALLAGVCLYAVRDVLARRARTEWRRPLDIALVLIADGAVDEAAIERLRRRVPDLAARLRVPFEHVRGAAFAPFAFVTYGTIPLEVPLPSAEPDDWAGVLGHAYQLQRFTRDADQRADVPWRGFDARIYLIVRPPSERSVVEGVSEHGGRIGIAIAELDPESVDTALFVAAHELFHTLGATDRYGPDGRTSIPEGLAEPELEPRFPQRYAELMARNRPLSETEETRPETLEELWVGPKTAREIGWSAAAR